MASNVTFPTLPYSSNVRSAQGTAANFSFHPVGAPGDKTTAGGTVSLYNSNFTPDSLMDAQLVITPADLSGKATGPSIPVSFTNFGTETRSPGGELEGPLPDGLKIDNSEWLVQIKEGGQTQTDPATGSDTFTVNPRWAQAPYIPPGVKDPMTE
jgi:hypothetical protein